MRTSPTMNLKRWPTSSLLATLGLLLSSAITQRCRLAGPRSAPTVLPSSMAVWSHLALAFRPRTPLAWLFLILKMRLSGTGTMLAVMAIAPTTGDAPLERTPLVLLGLTPSACTLAASANGEVVLSVSLPRKVKWRQEGLLFNKVAACFRAEEGKCPYPFILRSFVGHQRQNDL